VNDSWVVKSVDGRAQLAVGRLRSEGGKKSDCYCLAAGMTVYR
jgi:hypothetical protein